jgi:hypothetical protein
MSNNRSYRGGMPRDFYGGGEPYAHPGEGQPRRMREGQREHAEQDALRWGDGDNVTGTAAVGVPVLQSSKQLVRAHVPRPVVWLLQPNVDSFTGRNPVSGALVFTGATLPTGENANVSLYYEVSVGCGQSRTVYVATVVTLLAMNNYAIPPGAAPLPVSIPGGDLQVRALVSYLPTVAGPFAVPVGAMVAPWAHMPFGERLEPWAHEGPAVR